MISKLIQKIQSVPRRNIKIDRAFKLRLIRFTPKERNSSQGNCFTKRKVKSTVAHNCHGKTKKMSWSAVGQRLLFASEMVVRVTIIHCSLEKPPFFELTMFCTACGSVVDKDTNFCKSCGRGTFLNLKCSYLHFFLFQITVGERRHCYKLAD